MLNRSPLLRMKEESDTSNDVLERLASCHLISPHNHLISTKQESPPHASSSPSSTSVSSITSISKVSSSTNGNGASLGGVVSLGAPFDCSLLPAAMYENANLLAAAAVASGFAFHPAINSEQSRLLLMQEMARSALSSTSSTRSKSASSDGSNGDSPISSLSMSVKSKPGAKARSPGSGPVASSTGNREKVFVCQICNRSFGYKHVLQNHERTHTGEKPFECRECHKRFTRDHHLKTHMRLHTGEKPYHCSHCDRQFVQVANLRRHLRVHTGEKPYACELCTSRFSDSNQLKAHMLIHKGEKPFQCKKCDGRFRRRHHLMHHKCPKDEANLGKPRRGRRPKAYDPLQSASPSSFSSSRPGSADDLHHHLPSLLSTSAAVSSTTPNSSNSFYHHGSKHASHHLPHLRSPPAHHLLAPPANLPPTAHSFLEHNSVPKSRRKPRHTNRILPGTQNGHLFDDDDEHGDVQTQPLNLSISPALSVSKQLSSHLGLNAKRLYRPPEVAHDDVLDLSRSRSDAESEPEPIEEDEEDEELTAKEDDMEEMLMMHQNSDYLENGEDSFKRHPLSFSKHYSSNHINNNNNHCSDKSIFSSKLQSLDEKDLLESSNGLTALDLATLHLAKLENLKMIKSANTNGVASALKPSHEPKVAAESIVTE